MILKSLLQHHNLKASILQLSAFFMVQSVQDWKNHNLTIKTSVVKVMSPLFNMLSRFVIALLPRSKPCHPVNLTFMQSTSCEMPSWMNHIATRNINNLRYADDTTLIAESKEELKSLLMKEESGKAGLQLNILAFSHHFMANRWEKSGNSDRFYFLGLQNHCRW